MNPASVKVNRLASSQVTVLDLESICNLLMEFSPESEPLWMSQLKQLCESNHLIVARSSDNQIVGMATLASYRKPTGHVGIVEDVIVAEKMRGQGVGRKLMDVLIEIARARKLKHLELTSNPKRVVARGLYQSLGFGVRDTTCFRMIL